MVKSYLHQDFWDGVDGFYQPFAIMRVIPLRKIRRKLWKEVCCNFRLCISVGWAHNFDAVISLDNFYNCNNVQLCLSKVMLFNLAMFAFIPWGINEDTELTSQPLQLSFIYNAVLDADDFQKSSLELLKRNFRIEKHCTLHWTGIKLNFNAGYPSQPNKAMIWYPFILMGLAYCYSINGPQLSKVITHNLQIIFWYWFGQDPFSKGWKRFIGRSETINRACRRVLS